MNPRRTVAANSHQKLARLQTLGFDGGYLPASHLEVGGSNRLSVVVYVSSVQQVEETVGFHGVWGSFVVINMSAACPFFGTVSDLYFDIVVGLAPHRLFALTPSS
jgi:hypothetical protein